MNKIISDQYIDYVSSFFVVVLAVWLFNRICQCGHGKPRAKERVTGDFVHLDATDREEKRSVEDAQDSRKVEIAVVQKVMTLDITDSVMHLIRDIQEEKKSVLNVTYIIFPWINGRGESCDYTKVQELLNICNKLKWLEVLNILKIKRELDIQNIPSLRSLLIKEMKTCFFRKLGFLENLTEIIIDDFEAVKFCLNVEQQPQLKRLKIENANRSQITIKNPISLQEIRMPNLKATQVYIMNGSDNLETLILGVEKLQTSNNGEAEFTITGVYPKLKVFHTRSVCCAFSGLNRQEDRCPFLGDSLNSENFPALQLEGFIDKSPGPKVDPKATLLVENLRSRSIQR